VDLKQETSITLRRETMLISCQSIT